MRKANPYTPIPAKPNDVQIDAWVAGAMSDRAQFTLHLLQLTFRLDLSEPRSCRDGYFISPERDVFDCCDFVLISLPANA